GPAAADSNQGQLQSAAEFAKRTRRLAAAKCRLRRSKCHRKPNRKTPPRRRRPAPARRRPASTRGSRFAARARPRPQKHLRPAPGSAATCSADTTSPLKSKILNLKSEIHFPPTDNRCDTVRTYIRPPA